MDYALAKQLKDANFPTSTTEFPKGDWMITDLDEVYIPTLSELIEACGERFNGLYKARKSRNNISELEYPVQWFARTEETQKILVTDGDDTPSEAVAKLWLMLNISAEKKSLNQLADGLEESFKEHVNSQTKETS